MRAHALRCNPADLGVPLRVSNTLARGTRSWVKDAPLGNAWMMEYAMFCLGMCLAVAGGLATQYRLGRAHRDFEELRKVPALAIPRTRTRSIVSG